MAKEWFAPGRQTQLAITCTCLQAFLLFGYDQGVFGGLITNDNFLHTFNHPNASFLGIIVSIYNIGCLFGCLANFIWGSKFGRRQAIWISIIFVSVGAVLQCTAYSVEQLMIGRFITGFGVGIDTSTVPMYQSELCRPSVRGRLVTTEVLFTGLGVSLAYFFVFGLSYLGASPLAWRLPIACQIPPAALVGLLMFTLPETPRYLMAQGKIDEAESVMRRVFGGDDEYVRAEMTAMRAAVEMESENPFQWRKLFDKGDRVRTGRRVGLACLVLFMNQWAGINVIVFYAPTVMETSVGLSKTVSLVVGGCLNLAFAIGSIVPSLGLDKMGRRKPMMWGSFGMGVSMMMISILLSLEKKEMCLAAIAFFMTFMLFYGASLNAIPWCYSAEILPLKARAKGTSLAVMNNWVWVFVIVMVTPTMVKVLAWKTYLVFMACNFAFIPLIYFYFPETKGLSLEEIDYLFIKGSNNEAFATGSDGTTSGDESGKGGKTGVVHVE